MRKSVFKTHKKLLDMFEKRVTGLSYEKIADLYHVDHTTIIYWCARFGVKKGIPLTINKEIHITIKKKFTPPIVIPPPTGKYVEIMYEKTNQGKSYSDYLKEDVERRKKK